MKDDPAGGPRYERRGALVWIVVWLVAALLAPGASASAAIEVQVRGISGELESNVRAYLGIVDLAEEAEEADEEDGEAPDAAQVTERRVRRRHADARAEIVEALRPFGYYEPAVSASLERDGDDWIARYEVEPGDPTRIDELQIEVVGEGQDDASVREALRNLMLARGNVLRHAQYESAKQRLFEAAYDSGYIDAVYRRAEFLVRPRESEADVHLVLDTGPRYYFGGVIVEQDILDEEFIDRFVPIEPGDPFDTDRLIDLQVALGDSGYFNDVTIDVLRAETSNRRIPVAVRTSPRPNQEFTVGAGYGTDTGPRLRFGVELRRLNRVGHSFRTDLRVSAVENRLAAEYHVPVRNLATDYVSYRASIGQEEIGDFDTDTMLLGAGWNDVWRDAQRRVYLTGRREDFQAGSAEAESARALYAGITLNSQRTGDLLFTRQGYAWSADVRGGSGEIGASTSFARVRLSADYVRPLGERGRLLLRGEYGAIGVDDFARLVPSQRFFAGGDRSVRGYSYESLSPKNADGAAIGGRYLAVGSIEADYLFVGDYGAAVFYDAGNAGNDALPEPQRAVGIGLRWRSPVGMLRIDLAHPLDDPDNDYRLHLSIGAGL